MKSIKIKLFFYLILVFAVQSVFAQQLIGTFPEMDGGFEGQNVGAITTNLMNTTGASSTTWTSSQGGSTISNTGARTGSKFLTFPVISTSGSRRLHSPTTATQGAINGGTYTVQFYYKTAAAITNLQALATADAATTPLPTAVYITNLTSSTWALSQTTVTGGTAGKYGMGMIRYNTNTTAQSVDIDDFVMYAGSPDNTLPDAPTAFATTPSTNQITVSWSAPATGVDGGGYMVVRHTSDPSTLPNANGIYSLGNVIGSGTIVYIGNGTTFTDAGLTSSTTYFYRIYTVDKAYNYSPSLAGSSSTLVANYANEPTEQVSELTVSDVTTDGFTLNWKNNSLNGGTGHLVVLGTDLNGDPIDGLTYNASANFTDANSSNLAGGKVVYAGLGSSVAITGLTYAKTYYIRIYDFNGNNGTENYLTVNPISISQQTARRVITSAGSGVWNSATNWNPQIIPTFEDDVIIANGHQMTFSGATSNSCHNLTINAGCMLKNTTTSGTPATPSIGNILVYGNEIKVEGLLGDTLAESLTGIQFNSNCTLSGGGLFRLNRIRPTATALNATFSFDTDLTLSNNTGLTMMCENSASKNIGYKINSGRTVVSLGSFSGGYSVSTNAVNGFTLTVDGTLRINDQIYMNVANGQNANVIVNGTLVVKSFNASNTTATGGAVPSVVVNGSGTLSVTGSGAVADFSNAATCANIVGNGAFVLGQGAAIKIGSEDGLNPLTGPIRCSARSFNSQANYQFVAVASQFSGDDLPAEVNNLTVNNSKNLILTNPTTVNGVLTLAAGHLVLNENNLSMGVNGTISDASESTFVVTNGTGALIRTVQSNTNTQFPVGSGLVSYDPVSVTPVLESQLAVKVSATLPAIAPVNTVFNEKTWNISSTIPSSTLVELTPSVSVNTDVKGDVIGQWTGTEYVFTPVTKTLNTYAATFTNFSSFVTGTQNNETAVPMLNKNLFIVSNSQGIRIFNAVSGSNLLIYNVYGQLVAEKSMLSPQTTIKLPAGIYSVVLQMNNHKNVIKVIVP